MTTPTPAPAPMTANRLRELMEEATPGPIKAGEALPMTKADIKFYVVLVNNAPTILRLLEAVEGAEKALTDIKEWKLPPSNCYWDKDRTDPMSYETAFGSNGARNHIRGVATSALATLRAAREGAR